MDDHTESCPQKNAELGNQRGSNTFILQSYFAHTWTKPNHKRGWFLWEIQARQNIESCINQITNAILQSFLHMGSPGSEKQQVVSWK